MSTTKRYLLYLMSALYIAGGIAHFVWPQVYMPMMPPYLPWHLELVYLSGAAEFLLGALVLMPPTRYHAAWGLILLSIAVFPANIHIALHNVPLFGATEGAGVWNWVRLPLQGVLIAWAWWYTKPDALLDEEGWQHTISKPPVLVQLDELSRNLLATEPFLKALKTETDRSLVDIGLAHHCIKDESQASCLRRRWFNREEGWWKDLPPAEPIVRKGVIRAAELALEHKLPLDCYWVLGADQIKVAISKSSAQITVLFLSPMPPSDVSLARFQARGPDVWVYSSGGNVKSS